MEETAAIIQNKIKEKLCGSERMLVAIDGRCAAGKTTLAGKLAEELAQNGGVSVLHMDHFFLRPEQRTEERLAQPGGNVDYERFLKEALLPLKRGLFFSYRPFDCQRQELAAQVSINPGRICIIEGSYSCHPALWKYYDLRIFLTVERTEQLLRIEERNGKAALKAFAEKWIPMEERYFEAFQIEKRCDIRNSSKKGY